MNKTFQVVFNLGNFNYPNSIREYTYGTPRKVIHKDFEEWRTDILEELECASGWTVWGNKEENMIKD